MNDAKYQLGEFASPEHKYATFFGWILTFVPLSFPKMILFYGLWVVVGFFMLRFKIRKNKPADYHWLVGVGMAVVWPYMMMHNKLPEQPAREV